MIFPFALSKKNRMDKKRRDYRRRVQDLVKNNLALDLEFIRVESSPGDRFEVDWGHFGVLDYQGDKRKLDAFCKAFQ